MQAERLFRMNDNGEEFLHRMIGSSSPSRSLPVSSSPSADMGVAVNGGENCIQHPVSKFDTLAGVAIKYGVEVADIKRLNGLVTDLQMFALKTLQIPPGRHLPSSSLSNCHDTPPRPRSSQKTRLTRRHSDFFNAFPSLKMKPSSEVSPALMQGYYGLGLSDQKVVPEGFEMSVYRKGVSQYPDDDPFPKSISTPPLNQYRKSKSSANFFGSENGSLSDPHEPHTNDSDNWIEKLVRRRQKSEDDFTCPNNTPEKLLKEDNTNSSAISAITGKRLALRPKSASRTSSGNSEMGEANPIPNGVGDSVPTESVGGVRKSSSTSNLQDADNCALSSLWDTSKWSLKADFQALSTAAAITRPIFDGLPKPSNRRNKTAVD